MVLHLEETPQDAELQETLFGIIKGMLASIVRRYPTFAGNVIYILTSNYAACESVAREVEMVEVHTPELEDQVRWCRRTIEARLFEALEADHVRVELDAEPPVGQDMRPLQRWCTSVAFQVASHCAAYTPPAQRPGRLNVTIWPAGDRRLHIRLLTDAVPQVALRQDGLYPQVCLKSSIPPHSTSSTAYSPAPPPPLPRVNASLS